MTDPSSPTVSDERMRAMVRSLEPTWEVTAIDRAAQGTDSVATLGVQTPAGHRTVVFKATTADHVEPATARAEPRMLSLLDRETSIPVPAVLGRRDDHETFPAPFYLMEHVEGENFEGRSEELSASARERVFSDAGRYLAQLHELGPLPAVGGIVARDDGLTVLEEYSEDAFHDWLLDSYEDRLDSLADGGYFPHLADDRSRFTDLVPEVRAYLRETIPTLPEPDPTTYCNVDYRYGNLLLDPATGETQAVLDWGNLTAAAPAFNLASTESLLVKRDLEGTERADALRASLRRAYVSAREDWALDEATRERMRVYRLACRLDAMACLPLWYEDATPAERDERAREHREFVEQYL